VFPAGQYAHPVKCRSTKPKSNGMIREEEKYLSQVLRFKKEIQMKVSWGGGINNSCRGHRV
jgi:hypothetical protein